MIQVPTTAIKQSEGLSPSVYDDLSSQFQREVPYIPCLAYEEIQTRLISPEQAEQVIGENLTYHPDIPTGLAHNLFMGSLENLDRKQAATINELTTTPWKTTEEAMMSPETTEILSNSGGRHWISVLKNLPPQAQVKFVDNYLYVKYAVPADPQLSGYRIKNNDSNNMHIIFDRDLISAKKGLYVAAMLQERSDGKVLDHFAMSPVSLYVGDFPIYRGAFNPVSKYISINTLTKYITEVYHHELRHALDNQYFAYKDFALWRRASFAHSLSIPACLLASVAFTSFIPLGIAVISTLALYLATRKYNNPIGIGFHEEQILEINARRATLTLNHVLNNKGFVYTPTYPANWRRFERRPDYEEYVRNLQQKMNLEYYLGYEPIIFAIIDYFKFALSQQQNTGAIAPAPATAFSIN